MSNELERVADAIESARLPSGGTILASRVQIEVLARDAIAAMTPTPDVDVIAEVRALRDSAMYANFSVTQLDPRENDAEFVLAIRVSDLNSILDREPTQ